MKKALCILLAVLMCVSMLPLSALADGETPLTDVEDDISLDGATSVGNLIVNTIESDDADETAMPGCITDITVDGTAATVELSTDRDSVLIVAIYTEDGAQMLGSGHTTVTSEDNGAAVFHRRRVSHRRGDV